MEYTKGDVLARRSRGLVVDAWVLGPRSVGCTLGYR